MTTHQCINTTGVGGDRAPRLWSDIATIPADHLDGRDVLLWAGFLVLGSYCDGWRDAVGREIPGVTAWADVEGPSHG